jgi:hypothetical protein
MRLNFKELMRSDLSSVSTSREIALHFNCLQPLLDSDKHLPSGETFNSRVHNSHHVGRVAYLVRAVASIYLWGSAHADAAQHISLQKDFAEHLFYYQLAGLFHDTGREGDGEDTPEWEKDSAINFFVYLTDVLGLPSERALEYAACIINKDVKNMPGSEWIEMTYFEGEFSFKKNYLSSCKPIGWSLLQSADCLDVLRARKSFNPQYLDFADEFKRRGQTDMLHCLVTHLVREEMALISILGDDRFCLLDEPPAFAQRFYHNPREAYAQLVQLIAGTHDLSTVLREKHICFGLLPLLYDLSYGHRDISELDTLNTTFWAHPDLELSMIDLFQRGALWSIKSLENEAYKIIPGGYLPHEVGFLAQPKIQPIMAETPYNSSGIMHPLTLTSADIKGIYILVDFKRRCSTWLREHHDLNPAYLGGRYQFAALIAHRVFQREHSTELAAYGIYLSEGRMIPLSLDFSAILEQIQADLRGLLISKEAPFSIWEHYLKDYSRDKLLEMGTFTEDELNALDQLKLIVPSPSSSLSGLGTPTLTPAPSTLAPEA